MENDKGEYYLSIGMIMKTLLPILVCFNVFWYANVYVNGQPDALGIEFVPLIVSLGSIIGSVVMANISNRMCD